MYWLPESAAMRALIFMGVICDKSENDKEKSMIVAVKTRVTTLFLSLGLKKSKALKYKQF